MDGRDDDDDDDDSRSQADRLKTHYAMDDCIGSDYGLAGLSVKWRALISERELLGINS